MKQACQRWPMWNALSRNSRRAFDATTSHPADGLIRKWRQQGIKRALFQAHVGCQIGSYPFFREGRTGANFVVRSTGEDALNACATALLAALVADGREAVAGEV